jgi:hypothetical protein
LFDVNGGVCSPFCTVVSHLRNRTSRVRLLPS